jgi:hypothetical protein
MTAATAKVATSCVSCAFIQQSDVYQRTLRYPHQTITLRIGTQAVVLGWGRMSGQPLKGI